MKQSGLKILIREIYEEYITNQQSVREVDSSYNHFIPKGKEELAEKFFLATYGYVKKRGEKTDHHNRISDVGAWSKTTWKYKGVEAVDENKHFSRSVYSDSVSVSMDRKGRMIFSKGNFDDLKETLISILPPVGFK